MKRIILLLLLATSPLSQGKTQDIYHFNTTRQEQQFKQLSERLRCLVCQNQNIADSNAPLAQDLRQQIYQSVQEGKTDKQIIKYMTARYGDFVLFKPPVNAMTGLLWFGPFILLVLGFLALFRLQRRTGKQS